MVCYFKLGANVVRGRVWQFVYDTNRPVFLERDLVRLGVNGNWQVWVQYSCGEAVSIHMVRKGTAGFSNVYIPSTLRRILWTLTTPSGSKKDFKSSSYSEAKS